MSQASSPDSPDATRVSNREFLRSFFQDYKTVGAVRETSRGVAERICDLAGISNSARIAEFGCGTGPITRVILERMPPTASLWGYEVHKPFADYLHQSIRDDRFTLSEESATSIVDHRRERGEPPFDAIISTIPFSYLSHERTTAILRAVVDTMTDSGTFIALQYHPTYLPPLLRHHFDEATRDIYLWNVPPANLFRATKPRRL
jgi:phospholipid N-methyltransferase